MTKVKGLFYSGVAAEAVGSMLLSRKNPYAVAFGALLEGAGLGLEMASTAIARKEGTKPVQSYKAEVEGFGASVALGVMGQFIGNTAKEGTAVKNAVQDARTPLLEDASGTTKPGVASKAGGAVRKGTSSKVGVAAGKGMKAARNTTSGMVGVASKDATGVGKAATAGIGRAGQPIGASKYTVVLAKGASKEEKMAFEQFAEKQYQTAMGKVAKNPGITIHMGDPPSISNHDDIIKGINKISMMEDETFDESKAVVTDAWGYHNRVILKVKYEDQEFMFFRSTGQAGKTDVPFDRYYSTLGITKNIRVLGTEPGWVIKGFAGNGDIATQGGVPFLQDMGDWLNRLYTVNPPSAF